MPLEPGEFKKAEKARVNQKSGYWLSQFIIIGNIRLTFYSQDTCLVLGKV